jgi:hypothetical protein
VSRVLIIAQNLLVPFDRRVWLECQALTSAGEARAYQRLLGTSTPALERAGA